MIDTYRKYISDHSTYGDLIHIGESKFDVLTDMTDEAIKEGTVLVLIGGSSVGWIAVNPSHILQTDNPLTESEGCKIPNGTCGFCNTQTEVVEYNSEFRVDGPVGTSTQNLTEDEQDAVNSFMSPGLTSYSGLTLCFDCISSVNEELTTTQFQNELQTRTFTDKI